MSAWQVFVEWAIVPTQVLVIAGLVLKRRARRAWLLPVFLSVATVVRLLQLIGTDAFRSWYAWIWMELALKVLVIGVVLEITARIFARLPGAAPWAWRTLAIVLLATAIAAWSAPGQGKAGIETWAYASVTEVLPRMACGTAVLCIAVLAVVIFYAVPLDDLHGAVLFGLALYLLIYAGPLGSAGDHASSRFVVYNVTPLAYLVILAGWSYVAWGHERAPSEAERKLQPWH